MASGEELSLYGSAPNNSESTQVVYYSGMPHLFFFPDELVTCRDFSRKLGTEDEGCHRGSKGFKDRKNNMITIIIVNLLKDDLLKFVTVVGERNSCFTTNSSSFLFSKLEIGIGMKISM